MLNHKPTNPISRHLWLIHKSYNNHEAETNLLDVVVSVFVGHFEKFTTRMCVGEGSDSQTVCRIQLLLKELTTNFQNL